MQCQSAEQREHGIALTVVAQTAKKSSKSQEIIYHLVSQQVPDEAKFQIRTNLELAFFSKKKKSSN